MKSTLLPRVQTTASRTAGKAVVKAASKAASKAVTVVKAASKADTSVQATKPASAIFKLVAGTLLKIDNATAKVQLAGAIGNHVKLGNLERTEGGVKLTAQGAAKFTEVRVSPAASPFQVIAAWMHSAGPAPAECTRWDGQHKAIEIAAGVRFPNYIHWGSFASREMRAAFAALWASKK